MTIKGRHDRAVAVNTVDRDGLTRNTQHHFSALDGLRGIAALVVLALHALTPFNLDYIVPHAVLAVDFFFLLSGFVHDFRKTSVALVRWTETPVPAPQSVPDSGVFAEA
jgi:hypothetical protein